MLTASEFRDLVSGRRRGPMASFLRGVLGAIEPVYTWAVNRRNNDFDSGRREIQTVGAPVISIGNLTLGGTGKTPMVQWLARWFGERGVRIALVSRGYKSGGNAVNDEAKELAQKLPGVLHLQNPNRVEAARKAIDECSAQVILLDDAFQHRRIARNLDIVLLDALDPIGFQHVFPRGTLREPLQGLARANVAILTRADMVDETERERIRGIVQRYAPRITWAQCRHSPQRLLAASGVEQPLDMLRGQRVAAFCGIGNPAGFRHTLEHCGYNVVAWREFPDHYAYTPGDVQSLASWAAQQEVAAVVTTHKDLVKIAAAGELGNKPLWALAVEMEFLSGQELLEAKLKSTISTNLANTEQ